MAAPATLKSPTTGKTLIPIATRTTTPTSDTAPKIIEVTRTYVEVIICDSVFLSSGSQWGHAAIAIDDVLYSRAHEEYIVTTKKIYFHGGMISRANPPPIKTKGQGYRDCIGIILWLSEREKKIVEDELKRRISIDREFRKKHSMDSRYSLFDNSCSTNVADVLEMVGILAHDPRFLPFPTTPAELSTALHKSNRFVKKNFYPKTWEAGGFIKALYNKLVTRLVSK